MKIEVEVSDDFEDEILLASLKVSLEFLEDIAEKYTADKNFKAEIFDMDPTKDLQEINDHIDAFEMVIDYYSPGVFSK